MKTVRKNEKTERKIKELMSYSKSKTINEIVTFDSSEEFSTILGSVFYEIYKENHRIDNSMNNMIPDGIITSNYELLMYLNGNDQYKKKFKNIGKIFNTKNTDLKLSVSNLKTIFLEYTNNILDNSMNVSLISKRFNEVLDLVTK